MNAVEATNAISCAVFLLFLFLICRELVCWYWKVNKSVALLQEISSKLDKLDRFVALAPPTPRLDPIVIRPMEPK